MEKAAREAEPGGLLERVEELRQIDATLGAARAGEGAIVVVEGPAGIGKTRLLAAARTRAADAGMRVLSARGSDLEREFQSGVVRQLFEPAVAASPAADREELFAGAARLAARLVAPRAAGTGTADEDEGALLHGLYWLCANLAEAAPLLAAVDDAHWCDVPSLRFLAYLARRIGGIAVTLLVGSRPGESASEEELLARVAAEPGARVLHPRALSGQATADLLATRLGVRPDPQFADACQTATQGNPFLLEEVARAVRGQRLAPDAAAAATVADLGPRSVARAIMRRARSLAAGAVELAHAVSVLGPEADLRRAAELAGLDANTAGAAADALTGADILAQGRPLDFIHPLVRAAVYGDLPAGVRARLHRQAAQILTVERAPLERHRRAPADDGAERRAGNRRALARRRARGGRQRRAPGCDPLPGASAGRATAGRSAR